MKTTAYGGLFIGLMLSFATTVEAQPESGAVVATVGDESIYASQIEWEYQKKFADREIGEPLVTQLRRAILDRLIGQQLVLSKFAGSPVAATDDEVNLEVSRISERLKQLEKTLEQFLTENNQSLESLRFNVRWQISWQRYLDRTLNDQVLSMFFDRNRRELDGSRLHVAHLLLQLPENPDADDIDKAREQAGHIRNVLEQGQMSWEDATSQHSAAPSADNGGDMGWIDFDGPMPREFTEAAFALEPGQVSEPVRTSFGFHLIKCVEIEPGEKSWYDVPDKVRLAATEFLFDRICGQQRDKVAVRLTDAAPVVAADAGDD